MLEQHERRMHMGQMLDEERRIMNIFASIIPKLSETKKNYLLGLGEGMAVMLELEERREMQQKLGEKNGQ